jgi:hypothetical protein
LIFLVVSGEWGVVKGFTASRAASNVDSFNGTKVCSNASDKYVESEAVP